MKFVYISLLFIAFFSCKKGAADFEIECQVYDNAHATYLANSTIEVYKRMTTSDELVLVGSYTTDSEGKFSFKTVRDRFESLELKMTKTNYFDFDEIIYFSELSVENKNSFSYEIDGKSWVKVHVSNASNPDPNATMSVIPQQGYYDCDECCTTATRVFHGNIDSTYYCINRANTTYSFNYFLSFTGNNGTKSVTTQFGDTTLIELFY